MAIKAIVTGSVLSIISAVVSTAAFADNMVNASTFCKPGFYAGLQGGRSDTFYNPSNTLGAAKINGVGDPYSHTDTDGTTHHVFTSRLTAQKVDDIGLGGRLYAGYQFNPYFALETGYTQYAKTDFSAAGTVSDQTYPLSVSARTDTFTHYNGEITEHAIDLVGKATLPLQMGWGLYAKAGMAYIAADSHTNGRDGGQKNYQYDILVSSVSGTNALTTIDKHSYQGFRPVAGVGVSYTLPNTNMSLNADYTRVFSYGGIPNAKLASLGLEYKFA